MLSLNDLKNVLQAIPTPSVIFATDSNFTIAATNKAFLKITGFTSDELLNHPFYEAFRNVENNEAETRGDRRLLKTVQETRKPQRHEIMDYHFGGDKQARYWQPYSYPLIEENGEFKYIICSLKDVGTKYQEASYLINDKVHKNAFAGRSSLEEIQESQTNLRAILESSVEGFVLIDTHLTIKAFNAKALQYILLTENKSDVCTGKNLLEYIGKDRYSYFLSQVSIALNGETLQYERKLIKENIVYWFHFAIYPVIEKGEVIGLCIAGRDITEQKLAKQKLENSEKRYKALVENSGDGVFVITKAGLISYASASLEKILGYKEPELMGKPISCFLKGDSLKNMEAVLNKISTDPDSQINGVLMQTIHKNGNDLWLEASFTNMLGEDSISGIVVNFHDVTKKREAEIALVKSNIKLKAAQQLAKIGYWEYDVLTETYIWSEEHYRIWGLPFSSEPITLNTLIQSIHPDDKENFLTKYKANFHRNVGPDSKYRIVKPDGKIVHIHARGVSIYDEENRLIRFEGTVQDVSEMEAAQQTIYQSEENYRKIFEESPIAKYLYNVENLRIIAANDAAVKSYGYTREEFLKLDLLDLFTTDDRAYPAKLIQQLENKTSFYLKTQIQRKKNGTTITADLHGYQINYNNRPCMMVISKDLTEELEAKTNLIQSNERFKYAAKATSEGIWDLDLESNTLFLGEGFSTLFGFETQHIEARKNWMADKIHPDDFEHIKTGVNKAMKNPGQLHWNGEFRFLKADGQYAIVKNSVIIIRDTTGTPHRLIGAIKDVTAQKAEEHHLRLLESVVTNAADSVMITDVGSETENPKIIYVNEAFTRTTGFTRAEVIGKSADFLWGPKTDLSQIQKLVAAMGDKESCQIQAVFYKKNRESYWASLAIAPVADEKGDVKNYIAIERDISERMSYIHEIEEQNKKFRDIAWTQSHTVRAPLSRILGLADLMTQEPKLVEELLPLMQTSAIELDSIIREIVHKTERIDKKA